MDTRSVAVAEARAESGVCRRLKVGVLVDLRQRPGAGGHGRATVDKARAAA
jgi:hypothetical protein